MNQLCELNCGNWFLDTFLVVFLMLFGAYISNFGRIYRWLIKKLNALSEKNGGKKK